MSRAKLPFIGLSAALLFALSLPACAFAQPTPSPDDMDRRMAACTACHGPEGRATNAGYFPSLAGKPARYLFEQLRNFRDGRRQQADMRHLLARLSDGYLQEMAGYFAAQALPYSPPVPSNLSAEQLAHGQSLIFRGDEERGIPACASCHGEALTGVQTGIPGLLGLPRAYIAAQLGAWVAGQRSAEAPDCMAEIGRKLANSDVQAVVGWLTSQPMPADPQPVASLPGSLPTPCSAVETRRSEAPVANAGPFEATPEQVERGRYLALAGNCAGCHTTREAEAYAGGRGIETPFGIVYAGNLTPEPVTGIGRWTADHFWQALHEGRSRDGRLLYPAFPYTSYTKITREDSDALYAWLRTLAPVVRENRPHALRFPYDTQAALAIWRALFFRPGSFEMQPRHTAEWNRGAYLVDVLGHCIACHGDRNPLGATRTGRGLVGGTLPGSGWHAPALDADGEAGVAGWSVDEVVALFKTGITVHASVSGPMADVVYRSTRHLSEADLKAMAVYLQALPQRTEESPTKPAQRSAAAMQRGEAIYGEHCASCHGEQGEGLAGALPALAGNRAVILANPANLVQVVRKGGFLPATEGNPRPYGMPPFGHLLSDADIAAVLTYVRGSWGNDAAGVTLHQAQRR